MLMSDITARQSQPVVPTVPPTTPAPVRGTTGPQIAPGDQPPNPFPQQQEGLRLFGAPARELLFAGLFGDRGEPAEPVGPAPGAPNASVQNGTPYEIGPDRRPDIHHDNGFLQNPNDPSDPNPIPTREPTEAERKYYDDQVNQAEWANRLRHVPFADKVDGRLGLDNALPAYEHFLKGKGADREFDYGEYLNNDPAGIATRDRVVGETRAAADALLGDLDQKVGSNPGDSVTFQIRSDAMTSGKDGFGYPETEDWQKTIGGHSFWSSAEVTVTRNDDGSLSARAEVTMQAEDRYNFNPNQQDIKTQVPDSERGVLEETGLAHQYTQRGKATYVTEWTVGQAGTPQVGAEQVTPR